jgi:hypothetical protein
MSGERGTQTGVALALAKAAPEGAAEEEQEDFFEDLIGAPETERVVDLREKRAAKDGSNRGRTPGVRNRRTLEMANFLLRRYASPLEILAQIAVARVDELSASIGCTKLEALQEKRLAAIALVPYLHQKMPVAVDVTNTKVVHLTINEPALLSDVTGVGGVDDDVLTLTTTLVEAIEGGDT